MARQHAAAAAVFLVLTLVMTWPLGRILDRAVANQADPYLNTWILDWDWYATFHRPLDLFDANAFFPSRYSLAYSENLYGIAMLLFPLRAVGVAPITAYNLAVLGGFILSGFAAYILGRLVTGCALAGMTCGIFYAFVPFRFTHLSHVQHIWGGTLALLLASLLWYEKSPSWGRALAFAAIFLFSGLCNIHWLLFGSVAVVVTIAIIRPRLLPLAACAAAAALLLGAFLYPYEVAAKRYGMRRTWNETMDFSARPSDWSISNRHNRTYTALQNPSVDPERWLFPGALSLLLGGIGLASSDRKSLKAAGAWIGLGFFGSLGLHTIFHRFLFQYVPGFRAIRVPARWAAITYVGLAMLVAIGAALLIRRRVWVSALLAAAFLIELRSAPILWHMIPTDVPPVERWVAAHNLRAIIELPISPLGEYATMLRATQHHRPMVNGISGFTPPEYKRVMELLGQWSDELAPELRRLGVSHVIVHADDVDATGRAWLARTLEKGQLALERRFDGGLFGDWLFAVGGPPRESTELAAMLRHQPTRSQSTFGAFLWPPHGAKVTSKTFISGFAFSPDGIREVNLLVNNGAIRLPALLTPDLPIQSLFRWYPATARPKFTAHFETRPAGVWRYTDIQPEIVDGKGRRLLLEARPIEWP